MILHFYTIIHVLISLLGIFTGLIVLFGVLAAKRLNYWTRWFFITTIATSVTGFFFPFRGFTPALAVGVLSLIVLAVALFARCSRQLEGQWRWVYVIAAATAFYFNVFVLIVQSFLKIPALRAMAPTQAEQPFKLAQSVVLVLFIVLTTMAAIKFRPEPELAA